MRIATILAVALLGTTSLAAAEHAQAAIQHYQLNIPRQSLDTALKDLAQQTGLQIGRFSARTDGGAMVGPVLGDQTPAQALKTLLHNTGLEYKIVSDTTIAVYNPKDAASARFDSSLRGSEERAADSTQSALESASGSPDDANTSKEAGKKTSQDFRVAQVDQGKSSSAFSVGAQSSTSQGNSKGPSTGLAEIIVTAQKRDERLIDTPQSISVLSASDLSKLGASQFSDFADTVPGLSYKTSGPGFTQISLRGVTIGDDASPTVGIYVDDVPYGSSTGLARASQITLDPGLFDLDRIEVLRGPQGTLYGASTMGGLLKYVTTPPNMTSFGGDVQTGVSGTYSGGVNYDVAAAVNMPIVADKAAVRVSGFETHDGGYIDNVGTGQKDVNRSDIYGGRLDFRLIPIDTLDIRITGFAQNTSADGLSLVDYTLAGAPVYGSLDHRTYFPEPFYQQFRLVSGSVSYDLGLARLISISSYQTTQTQLSYDLSFQLAEPLNLGAIGVNDVTATDKFTQEVRLASEQTKHVEWLIGGFYTRETSGHYEATSELRSVAGQPVPNDFYTLSSPSLYEEVAVFGDLTWRLTDKLDVTGGARYAQNRQGYEQIGSGLLVKSAPYTASTGDDVTYLANTRYHFSDYAIGYLRFATGYRPGGPNFVLDNPTTGRPIGTPTFQPDTLKSYEGGYKAETADRRFGIDLDTYYIDWSNIQITIVQDGFGARANAPGGATVKGSELTLTARPTRSFTATGAFAYQDPYLKEADAALGAAKGERLPDVPHFTAALNADYAFEEEGLRPTVGATLRYVDARWASFDKSTSFPQYNLPDYTMVDLRSGVTLSSVRVQFDIHNLFNKYAEQMQGFVTAPLSGPIQLAILQPRTIGVTASVSF